MDGVRSWIHASGCGNSRPDPCAVERGDYLVEGGRLLAERERAGAVDDMELRHALALRDAAEEPEPVVERGERIVAAPDYLARHLDALASADLVEARLGLHQAGHELLRICLWRHGLLPRRSRDACIQQFAVNVMVRIRGTLQRPSLRFPAPERLRRIREGEVADAIAGG